MSSESSQSHDGPELEAIHESRSGEESGTSFKQKLSVRDLWERTAKQINDYINRNVNVIPDSVSKENAELMRIWLENIAAALWSWLLDVRSATYEVDNVSNPTIVLDLQAAFHGIEKKIEETYGALMRNEDIQPFLDDDTELRTLNKIGEMLRLYMAIEHRTGPWQPISTLLDELEKESEPSNLVSEGQIRTLRATSPSKASLTLRKAPLPGTEWQFKYDFLSPGYIRLLEINDPSDDGSLNGKLVTCRLEDAPEYAAISWTWKPLIESVMYIDQKALPITHNLKAAIQAITQLPKGKATLLWVDMVCCNRNDPNEMTFMVPQLAEIYHQAKLVYIWLGEANDDTQQLFESFKRSDLDLNSGSLNNFLSRPWFSSLWTLQEVALAQSATVLCGSFAVDWIDLETYVAHYQETYSYFEDDKVELPLAAISRMETVNRYRMRDELLNDPYLTLDYLVFKHGHCTVSFPGDRIYALLTLAQDVDYVYELGLRYNHHKVSIHILWTIIRPKTDPSTSTWFVYPCSTSEVYGTFLHHVIANADAEVALDVFCRPMFDVLLDISAVEKLATKALATKLSPWKSQSEGYLWDLVGVQGDDSARYAASRVRQSDFEILVDGDVTSVALTASGFVLDTITRISKIYFDTSNLISWVRASHRAGFSKDEFWRTMIAARGSGGTKLPKLLSLAIRDAWYPDRDSEEPYNSPLYGDSVFSPHLEQRVQEVVKGRQLVFTANGRIGLAPHDANLQDCICILYSCSVPIVLRSSHSDLDAVSEPSVDSTLQKGEQHHIAFSHFKKKAQTGRSIGIMRSQLELISRQPMPVRQKWAVLLIEHVRQEQLANRRSKTTSDKEKPTSELKWSIRLAPSLTGSEAIFAVRGLIRSLQAWDEGLNIYQIFDRALALSTFITPVYYRMDFASSIDVTLFASCLLSLVKLDVEGPDRSYLFPLHMVQGLRSPSSALVFVIEVLAISSIVVGSLTVSAILSRGVSYCWETVLFNSESGCSLLEGCQRQNPLVLIVIQLFQVFMLKTVLFSWQKGAELAYDVSSGVLELRLKRSDSGSKKQSDHPKPGPDIETEGGVAHRRKIVEGASASKQQDEVQDERLDFAFIGPCYLDGMMEGDAIQWRLMCQIPNKRIRIT